MMKWFLRILLTSVGLGLIGVFSIAVINKYVRTQAADRTFANLTELPRAEGELPVGVVFGAGVWDDGRPSNTLYDRVVTGVELYKAGRVSKLLMTGDRRDVSYDEPQTMKKLAMELGVPESAIEKDDDGKHTRESCDRAKSVFGISNAILVTQDYHLPRAIFLCRKAGIESIGIVANRRVYDKETYLRFREVFAVAWTWLWS